MNIIKEEDYKLYKQSKTVIFTTGIFKTTKYYLITNILKSVTYIFIILAYPKFFENTYETYLKRFSQGMHYFFI
jgi:hypothetical protein